MGIFDGILGGQGGLTTTTTNTTNPAQQAGGWSTGVHPSQLQNVVVHHNTMMGQQALNNPNTWSQVMQGQSYAPYSEMAREIDELRYILQRTVENYDELLEQHKALRDITEAERNSR